MKIAAIAAVATLATATPVCAQDAVTAPAAATESLGSAVRYVDSASPFGASSVTNADAAAVTMPKLAFTPDAETAEGQDKYFYFHRGSTDFATAYADIRECDGYARGLQSGVAYVQAPYPYAGTMAGAVGGMVGSAIASAIFGSAEKRRMRRLNMRTCMGFKGYGRYGLSKDLWQTFNFEEGLSSVEEDKRDRNLRQQALVASATTPDTKELGL